MAKDIKMKDLIKESFGSTAFSTVGGLVTQRPINPISVPFMSDLVEGEWFGEDKKRVDTGAFVEEVKSFSRMGEMIYREGSLRDVAKGLSELADKARVATLQETDDWFDKVTINKNMKSLGNTSGEFTKIAKEANALQQRMESLYEDMGHILGRYYEIDEAHKPGHDEDEDEVEEALDKVDPSKIEPEDDFEDRDDKDIDNDGDTDDSDKYLHKRRKAVAKAMGETFQAKKNKPVRRLKDIGN
jgi:hypothetical protein